MCEAKEDFTDLSLMPQRDVRNFKDVKLKQNVTFFKRNRQKIRKSP